jgi:hypothetical protein
MNGMAECTFNFGKSYAGEWQALETQPEYEEGVWYESAIVRIAGCSRCGGWTVGMGRDGLGGRQSTRYFWKSHGIAGEPTNTGLGQSGSQ